MTTFRLFFCIAHAVFIIKQFLNVTDNFIINTLTFNVISYIRLKHNFLKATQSVSINVRVYVISYSTYLNIFMHCFIYRCVLFISTRLQTVNIVEKIIVFYKYTVQYVKSSKNNTQKITATLKLKLLFFRILVLLFFVSSFSQVSSISFHGNFKYGVGTIRTKYGLLRGIVVRDSPLVEAYLGIPYASPPIGSLRFMPPITPSSWKDVRNADRFSPVCPQTVPMPPNGPEALLEVPRARLVHFRRLLPLLRNQSEDCLYLNIYIPTKPTTESRNQQELYKTERNTTTNEQNGLVGEKLSTILFIHGESYEWNSGNPYDGSELAAHGNVIVVTINFRLGILGFLKTGGKESAQGNFGLMDLVAGLHWLRENLPAFGGDSNKITIMGHGTGAALANILLVSPVSSDLIKRAVLISGSALSPWAIQRSPLFVKRRVAEQTGCHGDLLYDDLAPCLRTKKLSDLLAVKIDYPRFLSGFAPFVDGTVIVPSKEAISTLKLPLGSAIVSTSGIEFARFPKQDLIFGLTSVESYLDVSAQDLEFGLNETRRDRILRTYVRNVFYYHLNEIFAVLKNEYTDWEKTIRNPYSSRDATLSFLSDGHTASHLIKIGYMHSLQGGQSYFIHFKHKTGEEEYPLRSGSVRGEDVPFWLGLPLSPLYPQNFSSEEHRLSSIMVKYLSNFAKTGNPNRFSTTSSEEIMNMKHLPHESSELHFKKQTKANNNTDNNLETDYIALPKEKRQTLTDFDLNYGSIQHEEQKQYHMQLGYAKFQRNINNVPQAEKVNIYSYVHKKRTNLNEIQNDDVHVKVRSIYDTPHWETYGSVNQLYLELGNKLEHQSHYRGHKLSMWLNLVPQLHKHSYLNDISMSHHQFSEENMEFYDGNIRAHLQNMPLDAESDFFSDKNKVNDRINTIQTDALSFSHKEVTTDCNLNTTQFPTVVSFTTFKNNSNASESSPNVLENMDVLRRLSGKQLQSYTTALVATVAVGCFLLILNVLIFAGIYYQREKRAKDAKKMEQLEDNETYMNTPTKNLSNTTSPQTTSGKVPFGEYNCFDQKSISITDKYCPVENTDDKSNNEKTKVCKTSTIDLLNIQYSNDNSSINTCNALGTQDILLFKPNHKDLPLMAPYPIQTDEKYQDIGNFGTAKSEEVTNCGIPEPPPPPKSVQPNQGGILRISGTNQMSSLSKKRVHIKEISV